MKKFLSIILTVALMFSLAVSPAMALTTDEILNATGDNWETLSIVDLGEGLSAKSTSTNAEVAAVVASKGSNVAYTEGEGEAKIEWPLMEYSAAAVSKSDIIRDYPFLEFPSMSDNYLKWTQTQSASMFRIRKMTKNDLVKNGDLIRITMEICVTDMVGGMNSDGSYIPADGTDTYSFGLAPVYSKSATNDGSTTDGTTVSYKIPVNQWTTINAYVKTSSNLFSSIRFDQNSAGNAKAVKNPFPKTILLGKVIVEKIADNNQPLPDTIKYKEDFERYNTIGNKYTIDGEDVTNSDSDLERLPYLTPVAKADSGVFGEANLTYKDSANPNDKNKFAVGSTNTGDDVYKYTYPTSGTALGKYHLFGDASLGDTGVKNASFGLGYAGNKYYSTEEHLSAADRLAESKAKRSSFTLPSALSGKHMLAASGLYNNNASVRFNNIYGSHPTSKDVGKKFRVSFYAYPDSKLGAYEASNSTYESATPIDVDKSIPVSITVSHNGPVGNIYKYSSTYSESSVGNFEISWDQWNKVEFLCEITTESIDTLEIDNATNPLKNALQISQINAEEQIADTIYFDDFAIEQIEAGTQAKFSAYEFDGTYDVSAKITSTTDTGDLTVHLVVAEYDKTTNRLLAVYTSLPKSFNFSTLPAAVSVSGIRPVDKDNLMRAYLIDTYTGLSPYVSPANVGSIVEHLED